MLFRSEAKSEPLLAEAAVSEPVRWCGAPRRCAVAAASKHAHWVSRSPRWALCCSLPLLLAFVGAFVGVVPPPSNVDTASLWLPNGNSSQELRNRDAYYPVWGSQRVEQLVVSAELSDDGSGPVGDLLNRTKLLVAFDLVQDILAKTRGVDPVTGSVFGWEDVCFRPAKPFIRTCLAYVPWCYWPGSAVLTDDPQRRAAIASDPDPIKTMSAPSCNSGIPGLDLPQMQVLGAVASNDTSDTSSRRRLTKVGALSFWLPVDTTLTNKSDAYWRGLLEWENALLLRSSSAAAELKQNSTGLRLFYKTTDSLNDEIFSAINSDEKLIYLSVALVVVVSLLALPATEYRSGSAEAAWAPRIVVIVSGCAAVPMASGVLAVLMSTGAVVNYGGTAAINFLILFVGLTHRHQILAARVAEEGQSVSALSEANAEAIVAIGPVASATLFLGLVCGIPGLKAYLVFTGTGLLCDLYVQLGVCAPVLALATAPSAALYSPPLKKIESTPSPRTFAQRWVSSRWAVLLAAVVAATAAALSGWCVWGAGTCWVPEISMGDFASPQSATRAIETVMSRFFADPPLPVQFVLRAPNGAGEGAVHSWIADPQNYEFFANLKTAIAADPFVNASSLSDFYHSFIDWCVAKKVICPTAEVRLRNGTMAVLPTARAWETEFKAWLELHPANSMNVKTAHDGLLSFRVTDAKFMANSIVGAAANYSQQVVVHASQRTQLIASSHLYTGKWLLQLL